MKRTYLALAIVASALALGACGKGSTKGGQVAAKVDGDEVTVHQVNFMLARAGVASEAQAKEASKQILNTLIDQQLLFKKATEAKLDRDPDVMQAIEQSKRQIMVQSYLERKVAPASKPSAVEIHDYYAKNPALFENRRVFRFQEMLLGNNAETTARVKEKVNQGVSLAELARWLQGEKIPFKVNEAVKPAEQLPLDVLPQLQNMKPGQAMALVADKNLLVVQLVAAQEQPVTEDKAKPFIEGYLANKRRAELAQAEIKRLRDGAKIEYVGAFADAGKPAQAVAQAPAAPVAVKADNKAEKESLDKGIGALK